MLVVNCIHNLDDILNKVTNFECKTMLSQSITRYNKYTKYGFTFKNDLDLTYKILEHTDEWKTIIYARNIYNVSISIKNFIHVRPYNNETFYFIKACKVNECIICFRDPLCVHLHYDSGRKSVILLL
jgi:hypothetical protein